MMKALGSIFMTISVLLMVSGAPTWAQSKEDDAEYARMLKRLTERYQDYFNHQSAAQKFESSRVAGRKALKSKRQQYNEEAERARVAYIRKRKAAPDMSAQEREWEKQQKQYAREQEKQRAAYVLKKQRIQKIEKTTRKIPEEVESGLIPVY